MVLVVSTLFFLLPFCQCARILGIVTTPTYSLQIPFRPLWKELSLRGHQVTILTTDPVNDPALENLTEINLHGTYTIWNKRINMTDMSITNPLKTYDQLVKVREYMQDYQLSHPDVQKLIKDESKQFDLLVIEPYARAMHAFAKKFNCPLIHIVSLDAAFYKYELIGSLARPVWFPDIIQPLSAPVLSAKRFVSMLCSAYIKYFLVPRAHAAQEALVTRHFGTNYTDLQELINNVSLLFVHNDVIFHPSKWLMPSVIRIRGGAHLKPLKPLPKNIQLELDGATQGVVYWSFGSNVKSKHLSEETRNIMLGALSELPYLVLWKFELEDCPNTPDNVIISKWFPQQDVLRHPNIKLFITQGELQSLEDAVYSGVPIVIVPFGDQHPTVERMTQKGVGVSLDCATLSKESFKTAILELVNNPTYRANVKELAELAQDQQMKKMNRAIMWVEKVLRHRGAPHLETNMVSPSYKFLLFSGMWIGIFMVFSIIRLSFMIGIVFPYRLLKYYFNSREKLKSD